MREELRGVSKPSMSEETSADIDVILVNLIALSGAWFYLKQRETAFIAFINMFIWESILK